MENDEIKKEKGRKDTKRGKEQEKDEEKEENTMS